MINKQVRTNAITKQRGLSEDVGLTSRLGVTLVELLVVSCGNWLADSVADPGGAKCEGSGQKNAMLERRAAMPDGDARLGETKRNNCLNFCF